jgi:hypothetical protein
MYTSVYFLSLDLAALNTPQVTPEDTVFLVGGVLVTDVDIETTDETQRNEFPVLWRQERGEQRQVRRSPSISPPHL